MDSPLDPPPTTGRLNYRLPELPSRLVNGSERIAEFHRLRAEQKLAALDRIQTDESLLEFLSWSTERRVLSAGTIDAFRVSRRLEDGKESSAVHLYGRGDGRNRALKVLRITAEPLNSTMGFGESTHADPSFGHAFIRALRAAYLLEWVEDRHPGAGVRVLSFGSAVDAHTGEAYFYIEMQERAGALTLKQAAKEGRGRLLLTPGPDGLTPIQAMADLLAETGLAGIHTRDPDFMIGFKGETGWIDSGAWTRRAQGAGFWKMQGQAVSDWLEWIAAMEPRDLDGDGRVRLRQHAIEAGWRLIERVVGSGSLSDQEEQDFRDRVEPVLAFLLIRRP